jgi:hypothetical protein
MMDGTHWDWEEVHCYEDCETKYWFSNVLINCT